MNPTVSPTHQTAPRYARITGTGSYLPPRRLSNEDMAAIVRLWEEVAGQTVTSS